jgi:hypothetical protein
MKKIVDGKAYNTETATKVVGGDNAQYSDAWWGLYQTRHGAFFEVIVEHDGETIQKFGPVTDDEALDTLQKHAPRLVDQYFGPFPEGGAAERRMTIRVPENLAERIERAAAAKSLSLNSYAMRCFERCVAVDGHPKQEGAM